MSMIEIHYTAAGKRVFVCYPVTELEVVVCPLGDDCLGDGPTCVAVARALAEGHTQGAVSRSDESATLPYLFRFPCLPIPIVCDPDMEPDAVELRAVDFTAEAQARLLLELLRQDCVLYPLASLTPDQVALLHVLRSATADL